MNRNTAIYNQIKFMPTNLSQKIDQFFKRLLDIIFAVIGLICLAPFSLLIGILIKRDSPGPIIYRGYRAGKDNIPFKIYKFRTMYETDKSYQGPKITSENDPRITKVGGWLRDTKINEFPQLWNVLIGEMSLVGPRPEDPDIVKDWPEEERNEILSVRPGITSPASVVYHNEEKMLSFQDLLGVYIQDIVPNKIRLDLLYVRNRSFFADLDILLLTGFILIPRIFERSIPESAFFSGWINKFVNRFILWLIVDFFTALFAIGLALFLWRDQQPLNWGIMPIFYFSLILALLFGCVNALFRLDRVVWSRATPHDAMKLILSSTSVTLLLMLLDILLRKYQWLIYPSLPLSMIFSIGLMTTFGFLAARFRRKLFSTISHSWAFLQNSPLAFGERVLMVGCGEASEIVLWLLERSSLNYAFSIMGFVDDDPTLHGMNIGGYKVLGQTKNLQELIDKYRIGLVICTLAGDEKKICSKLVQKKKNSYLRVIQSEEIVGAFYGKLLQPVTDLDYSTWNSVMQERINHHG